LSAHGSTLCFAAHATWASCLRIVDAIGDVVSPPAISAWRLRVTSLLAILAGHAGYHSASTIFRTNFGTRHYEDDVNGDTVMVLSMNRMSIVGIGFKINLLCQDGDVWFNMAIRSSAVDGAETLTLAS
jgi:hypothetical protein